MNILESLECTISIEYSIWIQSAVRKSRTTPCSVRTRPTVWYHGYTVYKSTLAKSEITCPPARKKHAIPGSIHSVSSPVLQPNNPDHAWPYQSLQRTPVPVYST